MFHVLLSALAKIPCPNPKHLEFADVSKVTDTKMVRLSWVIQMSSVGLHEPLKFPLAASRGKMTQKHRRKIREAQSVRSTWPTVGDFGIGKKDLQT